MSSLISVDEFRQRVDDARAECKICGHKAHSLVRHLREKHNQSAGQYRKLYPQAPIASRALNELSRQLIRSPQGTDRLETFLPQFVAPNADALFLNLKPLFPPVPKTHQHMIPATDHRFVMDEKAAKATAFALLGGKNTYVEGPTGCGKTEGVKQLHARLGRPMKRVNMNGDVTAGNFIGTTRADVQTGTYFKHGSLPLAMRGGYTLVIDEIDYTPPSIAAVLNPVLEGAHELYLPDTDEHIIAERGFCVIGTANTGGKGDTTGVYSGTEVLNTALLDRFAVKLKTDYLDTAAETDMLASRFPSQPRSKLQKFVQAAGDVRGQFKNGLIPITLSTRKLVDIFEMEPALGLAEAVRCALLNWLDEDNVATVRKLLDNRGIDLK